MIGLEGELASICREAFDFPAPLETLGTPGDHVLELFHGPPAAFKDFGARFLAACMARLRRDEAKPLTILVATSGDTGAAVGPRRSMASRACAWWCCIRTGASRRGRRISWLATFERDGAHYFFADSKRPGHMAGPYPSVEAFIAEYSVYRGRRIVAHRVAETHERRLRMQAQKALRSERH